MWSYQKAKTSAWCSFSAYDTMNDNLDHPEVTPNSAAFLYVQKEDCFNK